MLVGDFLLSKGLLLSVDNGEFEMLKLVSEAVKEMSEVSCFRSKKRESWTLPRTYITT